MSDQRDMLSPQEIADRTGFHPRTILREIDRGRLRAFEPVKGDYRIEVDDYEAWRHATPVKPRRRTTTDDGPRRRPTGPPERGSLRELKAIEDRAA